MTYQVSLSKKYLQLLLGIAMVFAITTNSEAANKETTPQGTVAPQAVEITLWNRNFDSPQTLGLLKLALEKTRTEFGDYTIKRSPDISQGRALAALVQNRQELLNVINVVVDDDRESVLQPVRVVTDEGLVGYRVCIINRKDQALFENIRSHQDILDAGIIFGQGSHWPDTKILRANSLPVITSVNYDDLFEMLLGRRFHCFLRGANEAIDDLERHPNPNLMIEPTLAFVYPSTSLFFTSKDNPELAARIELGLRRAILDGSYASYFHKSYDQSLQRLNLPGRRIFRLNNPYISDEFLHKSIERRILQDSNYPSSQ